MNGLGILLPFRACRASDAVRLGTEAEKLGYSAVWVPEVSTFDALAVAAALSETTSHARLGSAIVPIGSRSPALLAMAACTLADLAPGRVTLGIGVSTRTIVESWHGSEFSHPIARVRDTLAILAQALEGKKTSISGGSSASSGFRLDIPPEKRPQIYLAALGPKMRKLAKEEADGLILNFLPRSKAPALFSELCGGPKPIEATAFVRVALSDGGGDPEFRIRKEMASYLRIEQYRNWLVSLGLKESAFSFEGGIEAAAGLLPSEFVNDIAIIGDRKSCRSKLSELMDSGIVPIVVPSTAAGDLEGFRAVMAAFAQ